MNVQHEGPDAPPTDSAVCDECGLPVPSECNGCGPVEPFVWDEATIADARFHAMREDNEI